MFDWVVAVVVAGGLIGVAFLMFAENVLPPIPSEVVMPLAGFAAAQGHLSLPGVVAAGTAGALAGAVLWKVIGRLAPPERLAAWLDRHGRWLTLEGRHLTEAERFFASHGGVTVFVGRLLPGVRTFISVPAGIARMPWVPFLVWSALGTAIWTAALAAAGYLLAAEFHRVERWLDPLTGAVIAALILLYVYRLLTWRRGPA